MLKEEFLFLDFLSSSKSSAIVCRRSLFVGGLELTFFKIDLTCSGDCVFEGKPTPSLAFFKILFSTSCCKLSISVSLAGLFSDVGSSSNKEFDL